MLVQRLIWSDRNAKDTCNIGDVDTVTIMSHPSVTVTAGRQSSVYLLLTLAQISSVLSVLRRRRLAGIRQLIASVQRLRASNDCKRAIGRIHGAIVAAARDCQCDTGIIRPTRPYLEASSAADEK